MPSHFIDALTRTRGMVTAAAKVLNCDRQTIYNAIEKFPEVKECLATAREHSLDLAELSLMSAVGKGEAWAVCFYLKTQGRKRGYVERVDVGADASTLEQLVLAAQGQTSKKGS